MLRHGAPRPAVLRDVLRKQKDQLSAVPAGTVPGMDGFDQSGGEAGFGEELDWMANPKGNPELAEEYMPAAKEEGVRVTDVGKYAGEEELLMVSGNTGASKNFAEVLFNQLETLGLEINNRAVPQDTLYAKFCGVPAADVAIRPNVAWGKDFNDAESTDVPRRTRSASRATRTGRSCVRHRKTDVNLVQNKAQAFVDFAFTSLK